MNIVYLWMVPNDGISPVALTFADYVALTPEQRNAAQFFTQPDSAFTAAKHNRETRP